MHAVCLLLGHNSRSGSMFIARRRDEILCCGFWFFPQNQRWRSKKWSLAQNLRLRLGFHSCFLSWNETLLTLGEAQAVFWGEGKAPKCTPMAPRLLLFWGAQSSFGGEIFRLGAQAVTWWNGPDTVPFPVAPGLLAINMTNFASCFLIPYSLVFLTLSFANGKLLSNGTLAEKIEAY